jgi:hypothetical protein
VRTIHSLSRFTRWARLLALAVAAIPATGHAALISYDVVLSPTSGPSGSGSFVYDDVAAEVLGFQITLGDFGPYTPVGTCEGCPIDLPAATTALYFDLPAVNVFIQQTSIPFQGGALEFLFETNGTYSEFNGRADGTYVFARRDAPIPEPSAALLFAVGFGVVGAARRRVAPR